MNTQQNKREKARGGCNAGSTGVGISVTPEELKRVRAIFVTMLIAQAIGGIAALLLLDHEDWSARLFTGLLLPTLPAFIFGLPIQAHFRPGTYSQNRGLVIRVGFIALLATLMGMFWYRFG